VCHHGLTDALAFLAKCAEYGGTGPVGAAGQVLAALEAFGQARAAGELAGRLSGG
jgi:hypothetical protein